MSETGASSGRLPLTLSVIAVALAGWAVLREPAHLPMAPAPLAAPTSEPAQTAPVVAPTALADAEARRELADLRRQIAALRATQSASPAPSPAPLDSAAPNAGPARFTTIRPANPAIKVTQKADGTFDIQTSDPALSGTVSTMTATDESGRESLFYIRVP